MDIHTATEQISRLKPIYKTASILLICLKPKLFDPKRIENDLTRCGKSLVSHINKNLVSNIAKVFWLSYFKDRSSVSVNEYFIALNTFGQISGGHLTSWTKF
jgi:hypothetical protein